MFLIRFDGGAFRNCFRMWKLLGFATRRSSRGNRTADGLGNFGKNREYVFGCVRVRVRVHVRVGICLCVCEATSSCIYGQLFH